MVKSMCYRKVEKVEYFGIFPSVQSGKLEHPIWGSSFFRTQKSFGEFFADFPSWVSKYAYLMGPYCLGGAYG